MTPSPRLTDLPFLAATLAMALALGLPWVLGAFAEAEERPVELGEIFPWAVPEPAVQLAGQAAAPAEPAQP